MKTEFTIYGLYSHPSYTVPKLIGLYLTELGAIQVGKRYKEEYKKETNPPNVFIVPHTVLDDEYDLNYSVSDEHIYI